MTLTKSDFKIASTCAKKLIYKNNLYKTVNDSSEYMDMIANGGYIVAKYAQLMYPNGIEIKGNNITDTLKETKVQMKKANVTLFEAAFESKGKLVRIDILEKIGKKINLIEVKSSSFDSIKNLDKELLEDVAYQTIVLKELEPKMQIDSYLYLLDKRKENNIEGLSSWLTVKKMVRSNFEIDELPAQNEKNVAFKKPVINFKYEKHLDSKYYINLLQQNNLLTLVKVNSEVNKLKKQIINRTKNFIRILKNGIQDKDFSISKECNKCEFNLGKQKKKNGYRECWGNKADIDPNIFDLYYGGTIRIHKKVLYLDKLIKENKIKFIDLDKKIFKGVRGDRQLIQYDNTISNSEWLNNGIDSVLGGLKYPLHFIDFETYAGAIPYHEKMKPYEIIAFQWSCHTIDSAEAKPKHSEWLNSDYDFPNFRFAEALMNQINKTGTPLMWSPFENTVLRNILAQMETHKYKNESLKKWLREITKDEDREGRFVDMNNLTLKNYFHPLMKGKTSIKKVLPAIMTNSNIFKSILWLKEYISISSQNVDLYDNLSNKIRDLENEDVVKEGTGAMRVYHKMMFDNLDVSERNLLKQSLLQYCKLDTMAMVIIWKYWMLKGKAKRIKLNENK